MAEREPVRVNGTVTWFDVKKGFGFLSDADGLDYFVHFSEIQAAGFRMLKKGQMVSFEVGEDQKGRPVARNVLAAGEREEEEENFPDSGKEEGCDTVCGQNEKQR